mgnify:CR=1 FL=1
MSDHSKPGDAAHQAAELILSDERLTSDLEDAEADVLLRWTLSVAQQAVAASARCGRPSDRTLVADAVQPLRQLAREISRLTGEHADLNQAEFLNRLLALIDAARQLECASQTAGAPPGRPCFLRSLFGKR